MLDYLIQFGKDLFEGLKPQIQAQAWWIFSGNVGVFVILHFVKGLIKARTKNPRVIQATALVVGILWMLGAGIVSPSGDPKWIVKAIALGAFLGASNVAIYDGWRWWQRRQKKK